MVQLTSARSPPLSPGLAVAPARREETPPSDFFLHPPVLSASPSRELPKQANKQILADAIKGKLDFGECLAPISASQSPGVWGGAGEGREGIITAGVLPSACPGFFILLNLPHSVGCVASRGEFNADICSLMGDL